MTDNARGATEKLHFPSSRSAVPANPREAGKEAEPSLEAWWWEIARRKTVDGGRVFPRMHTGSCSCSVGPYLLKTTGWGSRKNYISHWPRSLELRAQSDWAWCCGGLWGGERWTSAAWVWVVSQRPEVATAIPYEDRKEYRRIPFTSRREWEWSETTLGPRGYWVGEGCSRARGCADFHALREVGLRRIDWMQGREEEGFMDSIAFSWVSLSSPLALPPRASKSSVNKSVFGQT